MTGGHIKKLAKLQKKAERRAAKRDGKRMERHLTKAKVRKPKRGATLQNVEMSNSTSKAKDPLKSTRDRYLYALYFQTTESKRNRRIHTVRSKSGVDGLVTSTANQNQLSSEQASIVSHTSSSQKNAIEAMVEKAQLKSSNSPRPDTLDAYFAKQKSPMAARNTTPLRLKGNKIMTPSRATRRSLMDTDAGRRIQNYRKISADLDAAAVQEGDEVDPWTPTLLQGQALWNG